MRLWSLNPCYLDSRGLCGVWRETLLARKVILGQTKGYKYHPQLQRFTELDYKSSRWTIETYLFYLLQEANNRGYNFNANKIDTKNFLIPYPNKLTVTKGQLAYEFNHLQAKLFNRDKIKCALNFNRINVEVEFMNKDNRVYLTYANKPFPYDLLKPHPMFKVIDGDIEEWENIKEII